MSDKTFLVAFCTFWMALVLVCANSDEYNVKQSGSLMTCSVFDFEQKLLEKLVRLEMKMEFVEQKVTSLENKYAATVDRAVEKLENITNALRDDWILEKDNLYERMENEIKQSRNITDALSKVKDDMLTQTTSLVQRTDRNVEMSQNLSKIITSRIEKVEKEFERTSALSRMKIQVQNKTSQIHTKENVVFKAAFLAFDTNIQDRTLIFKNVLLNHGNAYDQSTGIFTVPKPGLYLFTAMMCVEMGDYVLLEINAAGKGIGWLRLKNDSKDHNVCVSGDGVAFLSQGDKVFVKCTETSSTGDLLYNIDYANSFTGILLN